MEAGEVQGRALYLRKDRSTFFPLTYPQLPGDKPSSSCSHFPAPSSAASWCCVILTPVGEQHAEKSWSLGQNNAAFAVSASPPQSSQSASWCLSAPPSALPEAAAKAYTRNQHRTPVQELFVLEVSCLLIYLFFLRTA